MSRGSRMSPLAALLLLAVIVVAGTVVYKLSTTKTYKPGSYMAPGARMPTGDAYPAGSPEDMRQLIEQVSRHMMVNSQEVPSVATIEDAATLRAKNSVFYRDAQNGDRLLIYSDKAILFSPSRDLVLNVMPVFVSAPQGGATAPSAAATNEVALIEVRNGSGINGQGKATATKLREGGLSVLPPVDAQVKTRYAETLIYVNSASTLTQTVAKIQELTGGKVVASLEGEGALSGDVVVIIGANVKR